MDPKDWKDSGNFFDYKEHQLFYKISGSGEPLILMHGFPTASWDWWKIWDKLADKYQVIALDMIGYGFSDKPTNYKYSIVQQVDIWETFLASMDVNSFHILAHDVGNSLVQEILARNAKDSGYSLHIKSVCFMNGGMFPEIHFPTFTQKILLTPLSIILRNFMGRNTLAKNFKKVFGKHTQPTEKELDHFWSLISYNNGKLVIPKLIKYIKERNLHKARWFEALQDSSIPKRLINGGADPISGKHMAMHYKKVVPDADVIILDEIGHYPQTEAPDEVLKHYFEFRSRLN